MFICCECCVLSGRGLCDELITRPVESYRMWCVVVCDLATPQRRPSPTQGCRANYDDDVFNPRSRSRGTRRPRSPRPVLNIYYLIIKTDRNMQSFVENCFLTQECSNPCRQVAVETKFCTVAPNSCGTSVRKLLHISILTPGI
jgi:hypothetical protein